MEDMKKIDISTVKYPNTFTLVDDGDFERLNRWKWHCSTGGYVRRRKVGSRTKWIHMHRLINNTPNGLITDHINRNRLDNRRSNLRTVSKSQNSMNIKLPKNNTSGCIGVSWSNNRSKWVSRIEVDKKVINLGSFFKKCDAIKARKLAEIKYGWL